MIALNNITFEFGSRAIYENANWHIKPGEKIGLIGANGTGKTTLLKLLVGTYKPGSGSISKAKDLKIGYLNQDLLSVLSERSILEVAMEAFERENQLQTEIDDLLLQLETDCSDAVIERLADKQEEFGVLGGYTMQYEAEEILAGLGFSTQQTSQPLQSFSGGWRMRVMLAKILLQKPDLLLLDEPTNHLDLPSIEWLENYLKKFEGTYIIVSHDRYFLDKTTTRTVESIAASFAIYAGNYSFYLQEKAQREEIQAGQFKNQQKKIKADELLIERFRSKASKAKMVQSRIKALDKLDRVEPVAAAGASVSFRFKCSKPSGRHVLSLSGASKSYGEHIILQNTHAEIEKGDKIALIGANGKGKSTLLRILAGYEKDFKGKLETGHNVHQSFFAQHQLESLHLENTILAELQAFAPTHSETELRSLLGCFLFTGDDVFKKIKVLSGGEQSRVALAKTMTADANFLIFDEPTNHLDMQSVSILVQALQQYAGTLIFVSHDRYLVGQVASKIMFIEDYQIKKYPGTYAEYEIWNAKRIKTASAVSSAASTKPVKQPGVISKEPRSANKELQQKEKKLNREIQELEAFISQKEALQKAMEAEMTTLALPDPKKMQALTLAYASNQKELNLLNENWEALVAQLTEK